MTLDIRCGKLKNMVENGGQLIDVRSRDEFIKGALQHAVNIPHESIPEYAEKLDKDKPVLLYCLSGVRASLVKRFLESLGFDDVHNLGGIRRLALG